MLFMLALLAFPGARPERQVILPFVLLHIQIHGLLELFAAHPYQIAFGIQYHWATCRALYRWPPRGKEKVPGAASRIPLCYLGLWWLKSDRVKMLTRINTLKSKI